MRTWSKLRLLNTEGHDPTPFPGALQATPKRLGDGAHLPGPRSRRRVHGRLATLPRRPAGARLLPPQPRPPLAPSPAVRRRLTAAACGLLRRHGWIAAGHPVASSERLHSRALTPHSPTRPARFLKPRREKKPRASPSRENSGVSRDFRLPAHFGPRLTRFRTVGLCGLCLRSRDAFTFYLDQNLRESGCCRCLPRASPVMVESPQSAGGQRDTFI